MLDLLYKVDRGHYNVIFEETYRFTHRKTTWITFKLRLLSYNSYNSNCRPVLTQRVVLLLKIK